ncbi:MULTISPECIES: hypothetical protein [unclassified Variovorax]|uniref:hypothetical protein n=1 Tax=unclassified Variovorax TaxID=663243 RepID=UPI0013198659|nr:MULTISPECIES: hypothetical protein [unclassified Variovorax]VTU22409.1 hypothetical protein SRS16CHR_03045 [Variovorax sp. SRS16]VTU30580.1 hypothetical protein E5CHR_03043 [Variovorax sp. PBL-E5]
MSGSLFVLTTAAGRAIRNPIDEDLRRALDEVFQVPAPSDDAAEPAALPSTWLRYEQRPGVTLVLEVYPGGTVTFDQWADAHYARELAPPARLGRISFSHALALWRALRAGDVGAVRCEAWETQ